MILPEVATPKGRSPEGVATEGKITHMTEGLIRAACPTQLCRIALQTRPTSQTTRPSTDSNRKKALTANELMSHCVQ